MTMPVFSNGEKPMFCGDDLQNVADQSAPDRVYAVACIECGWETDVVGGRVMPDHNECVMTVRGVQTGDQHCPGSGTEGERVA